MDPNKTIYGFTIKPPPQPQPQKPPHIIVYGFNVKCIYS